MDLSQVDTDLLQPAVIGAWVTALAASNPGQKALEKMAENTVDSGWGLGTRIVKRIRDRFSDNGDTEALNALEAVEQSGDTASDEAMALAKAVSADLKPNSTLMLDLNQWLTTAKNDPALGPILAKVDINTKSRSSNKSVVDGDNNVVVQEAGGNVTINQRNR